MENSQQLQYAVSVYNHEFKRYECKLVTLNQQLAEYEIDKLTRNGYTIEEESCFETKHIKRKITKLAK